MKILLLLLAIGALSFLRADETVDDKAGFAATFPDVVRPSLQGVSIDPKTQTPDEYVCATGGGVFVVSFQDLHASSPSDIHPDELYQEAIARAQSDPKLTLRSKSDWKLGDLPGEEMIADVSMPPSVIRTRLLVAAGRVYTITYEGPTGTETSAAAIKFLDSFRLIR